MAAFGTHPIIVTFPFTMLPPYHFIIMAQFHRQLMLNLTQLNITKSDVVFFNFEMFHFSTLPCGR